MHAWDYKVNWLIQEIILSALLFIQLFPEKTKVLPTVNCISGYIIHYLFT